MDSRQSLKESKIPKVLHCMCLSFLHLMRLNNVATPARFPCDLYGGSDGCIVRSLQSFEEAFVCASILNQLHCMCLSFVHLMRLNNVTTPAQVPCDLYGGSDGFIVQSLQSLPLSRKLLYVLRYSINSIVCAFRSCI
jgi:hypothetical protein